MTHRRIIFAEFVVESARSAKYTGQVTDAVNFFAVRALANDIKQEIIAAFELFAIVVGNFNGSVKDVVGVKSVAGKDNQAGSEGQRDRFEIVELICKL